MEYTNNHNLPQPIVSAIRRDTYVKVGDISVTELIKPLRIRQLELRHDKEIIVDVSEYLWMLLGSSVHAMLERADTSNHLSEERLTPVVHGCHISGTPDLLTTEMTLQDYKVTSVYSFLLGDKPEWTAQLNLYAWLYRKHGFEAKAAQIVAILRDWMVSRALREPDYPQAGFMVVDVPLWSQEEQEALVGGLVRLHQTADKVVDNDLPECTPEERWQKEDVWAVKKKGNKRAMSGGLYTNEQGAKDHAAAQPSPVEIEFRPGESIRCSRYCKVAPWCNWWAVNKPPDIEQIQKEGE